MRIQVFSEYYRLAQAGVVKAFACPMHKEDPEITFELTHMYKDDKVVLHCLACGYKIVAGQQLYEKITNKIRDIKNGL